MSSIARFSYKNVATVWKRGPKDHLNGGSTWGEPFTIACTWIASSERRVETGNASAEFTSKCDYFHEDPRPDYMDKIKRGDHTAVPDPTAPGFADDIRAHLEWDMALFKKGGKPENPDFKSTV